jgi:RNA polymerase sigma factor (sigma-70 family)
MLSPYIDSLSRVIILDREEELLCFLRWRDSGCVESKRRLLESNLRLVFSIARSYTKDNSEDMLENLISAGNEGLIRALSRYDPTKGTKFSTYCGSWVLMHIRKYLLEDMQLIKAPSSVRRRAKMSDVKRHSLPVVSSSVFLQISDPSHTPEEMLEEEDFSAKVDLFIREAISWLPPRECKIVAHYYGVAEPRKSLQDLGDELCLSSERIRQLRNKAEARLSTWLSLFGLDGLVEVL